MAQIREFKAYVPNKKIVKNFVTLPYYTRSLEEECEFLKKNQCSFIKVERAEVDVLSDKVDSKIIAQKANYNLNQMIDQKIFTQEDDGCMYIYKQIMNDKEQVGLVTTVSIDDYLNNTIKKHEMTRKEKEEDRYNYIKSTNANTSPIFLTYKHSDKISTVLNFYMREKSPIYNFITEDDNVNHIVWRIDNKDYISDLISLFKNVDALYIADGHHRLAASARVALKRRNSFKKDFKVSNCDFFMAVLFPHNQLTILDYNRIIHDLNGYTIKEFMQLVSKNFDIERIDRRKFKPNINTEFGMYLDGVWYKLKFKREATSETLKNLSVSILHDHIIEPILEIKDVRSNSRIEFIGGIEDLEKLEKKVDQYKGVGFTLNATSINELIDVAESEKIMPPKSTWFEPKLRSGLFVYKLD